MVFREKIEIIELASPCSNPVFTQLKPTRAASPTMIITTGGFLEGAKQVAWLRNVTSIFLMDGDRLTDLLIDHEKQRAEECGGGCDLCAGATRGRGFLIYSVARERN